VTGRDPAKAAALAEDLSDALEADVQAVSGYAEALDGADIAATTTHTVTPGTRRPWLTPGVHITSLGYNLAGREIDDARSPRRWCASNPARPSSPRTPQAARSAHPDPRRLTELGELISGSTAGRTAPDRITLYRSVGVAVQDATATALVLASARERSIGEEITLQ
jgi:ornithine cyclodeaminase/alanine dehydrogenase-like protein (mu-crystallin family)